MSDEKLKELLKNAQQGTLPTISNTSANSQSGLKSVMEGVKVKVYAPNQNGLTDHVSYCLKKESVDESFDGLLFREDYGGENVKKKD